MLLRKVRCFRLDRRCFRVWRSILRGRSRSYRRLEHDRSPTLRLLRWVRSLRQRICAASVGGGGGDEGLKWLLLEEEERPPPKGHLVVYVGGGEEEYKPPQRYLVPVFYFNHPLFGELLREAEEEFGFDHPRGITIPCPAWRFERVQTRIAAGCTVACRKSGRRIFGCL